MNSNDCFLLPLFKNYELFHIYCYCHVTFTFLYLRRPSGRSNNKSVKIHNFFWNNNSNNDHKRKGVTVTIQRNFQLQLD